MWIHKTLRSTSSNLRKHRSAQTLTYSAIHLYVKDASSPLQVCNALSDSARKDKVLQTPDSLFRYLIERVRSNLHVVLCMSPVGDLFR